MKFVLPNFLKKNRNDSIIEMENKTKQKFSLKKIIGALITQEKKTEFNEAEIIELPPYEGREKLLEQYWLTPPFAYANLFQDKFSHSHYEIIEPKITESEYIILEEIIQLLRTTLVYDAGKKYSTDEIDRDHLIDIITSFDAEICEDRLNILIYYLNRNLLGYGKLDPLMHDERIEDITCNGADIPIYLYHQKYGNVRTNCVFDSKDLNKYVMKLAQKADKQVSLTTPLVDASLPEGARVQLTYSDIISSNGSSFTIRKFKSDPMTPIDLVMNKTYTAELMAHLWLAVENRRSMLIAGGTASGKTSTMNAISFFIPYDSKIVSIEDTREIQLPKHENWLSMRTRENITTENMGNVDMFSLLKAALRQRPEFIIVGEVRGEEAQTLFQAMNTGHTTYSTLHAGKVNEAISRLTHEPINVPVAMFSALHLILIQGLLYGKGKGFRRCLSLNEISVVNNEVLWTPLFIWDNATDSCKRTHNESRVFESIATQNGWSNEQLTNRLKYREREIEDMVATGKISALEIGDAILNAKLGESVNA